MKVIIGLSKLIVILALVSFSNCLGIGNKKKKVVNQEDMDKYLASDPLKGKGLFLVTNILWEGHLSPISEVCGGHPKYIIALRETGATSIARIKLGAKAKPHTILEKSVKQSSMEKVYGEDLWEEKAKPFYNLFKGFVGHYAADNKSLIGLRTDGWKAIEGQEGVKVTPCEDAEQALAGCTYLVTEEALKLLTPELVIQNAKQFYTGDYDLHEVYNNGQKQIPEAQITKVDLLNKLNRVIATKIPGTKNVPAREGVFVLEKGQIHQAKSDGTKTYENSYGMFQHGDQATYKMNQHLEAATAAKKGETVKATVIKSVNSESDEPIGWNVRGIWYVTKNQIEHRLFRAAVGLVAPEHWKDGMANRVGLTYVQTMDKDEKEAADKKTAEQPAKDAKAKDEEKARSDARQDKLNKPHLAKKEKRRKKK